MTEVPEKLSRPWLQLIAAEALLLCCVAVWMQGDLWYDEVLSLNVVFGHDTPWGIFRDYRFANNHFLSNFLEWIWLRGLGMSASSEVLVRVPPLLCSMGTVAVALLGWRRFLGERGSLLAAVAMACSPVFTAFAWQFRGYSLAMLLGALAVCAGAYRSQKITAANGFALFLLGLLLPLVMPPAAMLPCALALALFVDEVRKKQTAGRWAAAVRAAWPPLLGAFLGVAYYLTLLEQFRAATRESGGWNSAWLVGVHVLLAFALHLGVFGSLFFRPAQKSADTEAGVELLCACLLALVAVLLVPSPVHRAPFPRVFLPLLPAVTFGVALLAKNCRGLDADWNKFMQLVALELVMALIIRIGCEAVKRYALDLGKAPPQNLLVQYYRGDSGISALLQEYAALPEEQRSRLLVLVSPYDVPTCGYYWMLYGLPESGRAGLSLMRPANLFRPEALAPYRSNGYSVLILARHGQEAREWASAAGFAGVVPIPVGNRHDHHQFFRVDGGISSSL